MRVVAPDFGCGSRHRRPVNRPQGGKKKRNEAGMMTGFGAGQRSWFEKWLSKKGKINVPD